MQETHFKTKAPHSATVETVDVDKTLTMISSCSAGETSRIGLLEGKLSFGPDWWKKDRAADAEIERAFAEA